MQIITMRLQVMWKTPDMEDQNLGKHLASNHHTTASYVMFLMVVAYRYVYICTYVSAFIAYVWSGAIATTECCDINYGGTQEWITDGKTTKDVWIGYGLSRHTCHNTITTFHNPTTAMQLQCADMKVQYFMIQL